MAVLLVFVSAVSAGCTSQACTLVGGIDGVGIHLAGGLPGQLAGGTIRICIDASCSDQRVDPASSTVTESCSGDCADSGPATGARDDVFASMATDVPRKRAVTVTVTAADVRGVVVAHGSADKSLTDTYFNGPDCGVTSRVGGLTLTPTGLTSGS